MFREFSMLLRVNLFTILCVFFFSISMGFGKKFSDALQDLVKEDKNRGDRIQSIFSANGDIKLTGGYGGPYIKTFFSANGEGTFIGGKGAFIYNRFFAFGGFGSGFVGSMKKDGYDLGMGFGGIYGEVIPFISSPLHLAFTTYLGLGGFGGKKGNGDNEEKIRAFGIVVEPELNIELNLTHFLILSVGGSYQFVFANFEKVLKQTDFNGFNLNVTFKFGKF